MKSSQPLEEKAAGNPNGSGGEGGTLPPLSKPSTKRAATKTRPNKQRVKRERGLRRTGPKPYPVVTFEEASILGKGIIEHSAGHPMKRVTLLQKLKLPNNNATKNLITTSNRYNITQGRHDGEEIKLTPTGRLALDPEASPRQRAQAQFELAIKGIEIFFNLYEKFKGGRLPAPEVMRDSLDDLDLGDRPQCVDIFISNAKAVGILKTVEGAPRLITLEELLDTLPAQLQAKSEHLPTQTPSSNGAEPSLDAEDFDKVCFFIAPIGDEGTEQRKHSDAILASFVEPTLAEHKLKIIRADKITKPGMISAQVIEYVLKSKLVVADLSFHNPNAFYELCLRHVTGKPTVHIIRESDEIPFDVGNFRTITLKMDSIYSVLERLDTYRAEIAQQIRQVLSDGISTNNPILKLCPTAKFTLSA